MTSPHALAIIAPTASGKTALALKIAQHIPCEIISLDSALVYQHMDIGTAKPSASERAAVPHHLIDIISPLQAYSAADFVSDCLRLVDDIRARGKLPLIVGGTMMYYHALTQGLNDLPEADATLRQQLHERKTTHGLSDLYAQLQATDPITAARLSPSDAQRIERALEVFLLTGKPLSQHFIEQNQMPCDLPLYTIALIPENRSSLHTQINQRFIHMIKHGFLDEVRALQQRYPNLSPDMPSMRCVGYRQAWAHLAGEISHNEFIAQGQAATRQLAKRQLTWLRKMSPNTVFDPFTTPDYVQAACHIAQSIYHT